MSDQKQPTECSCGGHAHQHEHAHTNKHAQQHSHSHGESCGCNEQHQQEQACGCGVSHSHHHDHAEECSCGNHDQEHQHSDECKCGNAHDHKHEPKHGHDHVHEHNHGDSDSCGCGHDHAEEHVHAHGENCSCGGHDHEHAHDHEPKHQHGDGCSCGHDHAHEHSHNHEEPSHGLQSGPSDAKPLVFRITGLDCPDCAAKLAQVIRKQSGVTGADLSYAASRLQVYTDGSVSETSILSHVRKMGYEGELIGERNTASASKMRITGLDCPDCAAKLERQLRNLPGVTSAELVYATGTLMFEPAAAASALITAIERAGYQAEYSRGNASPKETQSGARHFWLRNRRSLLTGLSGLLLALGWLAELFLHVDYLPEVLFGAAMLSGGYYVARSGFYALLNRTLDMNFLMTIAAVGAVAIGEWHEGAMVVFLFSLGNTLQSYTMDKTRNSIRSLMDLAPKTALIRRQGMEMLLPTQEILLGDQMIIRPGERIAMDGIILNGHSAVNQAPITGESIPVDKLEGDRVFAGTINGNGSLEVRVDRLVEDNTLNRIMHLVEEAQGKRAPAQQLVERFAAVYTPVVTISAILIAVLPVLFGLPFLPWFKRALILLVVSCPCALVISTPVSIVSAIGNASRQGVLIKGGAYLEAMGRIRTVAFDKTGTLTSGTVVLKDVKPLVGSESALLLLAAGLEARSEHPLGQAIVKAAKAGRLELPTVHDFQALTGLGATGTIEGTRYWIGSERLLQDKGLELSQESRSEAERLQSEGKTVVFLADERQVRGLLALADVLRPEVAEAIAGLRQSGIEAVAMLTGDNRRTADSIARSLLIDVAKSELLPEDKVAAINELLAQHQQVAMVGDGVNDAPALAASTVGIALGVAGTDTAIETADIALMSDDLRKLSFVMRLSRRTVSIIKQNIVLSLAIKFVVLGLTIAGLAELWMGVFADTGAALIVILNGMRLSKALRA